MSITLRMSLFAGAVVSSVCVSVVLAQTPVLDVRMGLWEMTNTTNIGGQMPGMDMSKMTPEQRAQMEAAMKNMMGAHTTVTKTCVTKEKFDKGNFMSSDEKCKATITTNTQSVLEMKQSCPNEQSQMRLEALSPTSVKATFTGSGTDQGKTMTVSGTIVGKWLGANCGDVK
jgi:hypothetical protein